MQKYYRGHDHKFMNTYFTEEEEAIFFKSIRKTSGILAKRDAALFGLLRASGIRVGTLCGLEYNEINTALNSNETYFTLRDEICKNKNGYQIFLTKKIRIELKELIRVHKSISKSKGTSPKFLVLGNRGQGIKSRAVQMRMKTILIEAGLSDQASPHWWRHSKAMGIMRSEARDPRGIIQRVLGHVSDASSLPYMRPTKEHFEEFADA
jgi:site-specific recombinase XerC